MKSTGALKQFWLSDWGCTNADKPQSVRQSVWNGRV